MSDASRHAAFVVRSGSGVPIVLSVPHGGRAYPDGIDDLLRDPAAKVRLEDRYVDAVALTVAAATGTPVISANAPRALIDLNRAPDDMDWDMVAGIREPAPRHSALNRRARSGLGLVPRRLPGLGEIWRRKLPRAELDARIAAIHRPYHATLSTLLEDTRDRWGAVLLLDIHSMPPLRPAAGETPIEYVIGDRFGASCAADLSGSALAYLAKQGRIAAHNRPYSGGYILERHAAPRRGIHAMQIEICRSTYLDAALAEPSARLGNVVRIVSGLVRILAARLQEKLAWSWRQAAE